MEYEDETSKRTKKKKSRSQGVRRIAHRTVLLLTAMAVALVVAGGVAAAVSKTGTSGDDILRGTDGRDTLAGGGGDDRIYGKDARDRLYGDSGNDLVVGGSGPDQLFGGQGSDRVYGGPGNDFINVADERGEAVIDCGGGTQDEVIGDFEDKDDINFENCEFVSLTTFEFGADMMTATPETLTQEQRAALTRVQ